MSDPERPEAEEPGRGDGYSKEEFQRAEREEGKANKDWDEAEDEGLDEKDEESSDFAKRVEEAAEKKEKLIDQAREEASEEDKKRKKGKGK